MSGIVGVVNLDGAPVDRQLLEKMTTYLVFHGPDAQRTWIDGHVGFGHTLLRTTWESEREHQPLSVDGRVWITADDRIDDRESLVDKLNRAGREVSSSAPDVELILHAYHAWGESCVEHLLGDFAFAIWDGPRGRLFCARDHLGVRPFYYFRSSNTFVFSNTLNCLRRHPNVSDDLNDLAIADYLLFDLNQDAATTTFADIKRLPPAHSFSISRDGSTSRRYWSMPIDEPVFYKRGSDYVDRFVELLTLAVRDRVRTSRIGILMSGGVDSTSLAAVARHLLNQQPELAAFTQVFDRLIPDRERYYAGLVADRLGIPIHYLEYGDGVMDPEWQRRPLAPPEPSPAVNRVKILDDFREMAQHGRVALYGEGPDNALWYEWQPYLRYLVRTRQWPRLVRDVLGHAIAHRRIVPTKAIADYSKHLVRDAGSEESFPAWLNDDFEAKTDARARWEAMQSPPASPHPLRPMGFESLGLPHWQRRFEWLDPAYTEAPLEFRHPYLDLRLLRYMLSVPALPWCRRKYLLRRAMRGLLPEEVLSREKTGLMVSPLVQTVRRKGMPPLVPTPDLLRYVDPHKLPSAMGDPPEFWMNLRPAVLNHWLWCYSTAA
jgi:asparagine synthase (glutamine-hydrolysing)